MKGHSPYKLSDPSEAFKRLNKLSILIARLLLLPDNPTWLNLQWAKKIQIKLPSSIFYLQ
jgi:hypothetical protein